MLQLKHVICSVCEKGILTVVVEVGVEAQGTTTMFQSLSAAQARVYRCDNCGKSFVKVDNEFLELISPKNPLVGERLEPRKKKVMEVATIVKEPVTETKQIDVSLTHEKLVRKETCYGAQTYLQEAPRS
jgi:hypothetical protein